MPASASSNRLYCPIVFKLAARIAQLSWSEFTSDPLARADALRNAQAALGIDLIVNWFDDWSECEQLGARVERDAEGRVLSHSSGVTPSHALAILNAELTPKLIDAASSLHAQRRAGTLVAGYLTGPKTMTDRLSGWTNDGPEVAVQWALEMVRSYGELGLDLTIIAEDEAGVDEFYCTHQRTLAPVANLSRYYRHPLVVLNRARAEETGIDVVSGGASQIAAIAKIPDELFSRAREHSSRRAVSTINTLPSRRTMLLSSWEISPDVEPELVLELGRRWKGGA